MRSGYSTPQNGGKESLPGLNRGGAQIDASTIVRWAASPVPTDCLLAGTGTCIVACPTSYDRLMCDLPPVCAVIAETDRLFEHLPAVWGGLGGRVADPQLRRALVFISGPSRAADIEKTLIRGVDGPKRPIVLLVG